MNQFFKNIKKQWNTSIIFKVNIYCATFYFIPILLYLIYYFGIYNQSVRTANDLTIFLFISFCVLPISFLLSSFIRYHLMITNKMVSKNINEIFKELKSILFFNIIYLGISITIIIILGILLYQSQILNNQIIEIVKENKDLLKIITH